jgi:hypothetical protein
MHQVQTSEAAAAAAKCMPCMQQATFSSAANNLAAGGAAAAAAGDEGDVMVTQDSHRGIRFYEWAEDSKHIIFLQASIRFPFST